MDANALHPLMAKENCLLLDNVFGKKKKKDNTLTWEVTAPRPE